MIPQHCADVGIEEVNFSLSERNLREHFIGRSSYARTKFYVVSNGKEWAVIQPFKIRSADLFQKIKDVQIVSGPDRTRFLNEPDLDVLRVGDLLRIQSMYPKDLVVVKGRFEHISFVDVRLPAKIRIIDTVPPIPSKLEILLQDIIGEDSSLLNIEVRRIDIDQLIAELIDERIMLPCRGVSYKVIDEATEGRATLFLDSPSELSKDEAESIALVGCSLSGRIFEELYGKRPRLINICSRETMTIDEDDPPTISRCCKIKNGAEVEGRGIFVPWGANLCDIAEALRFALNF